MTNKISVGIVGGGAVGRAVAAYYEGAKIYDKYKKIDSLEAVSACDFIFVAVPTPFTPPPPPPFQGGEIRGGGQDLTEMDDAIASTVSHLINPEKQVIIIKSTVLPGATESYQAKYPEANFIFNPEFLTERTAVADFAKPDKQLVGYTPKTKALAEQVMSILPPAPYEKILPAKVCEMAKYAINGYYAFKVIFANSIYDICEKLEIDYDLVREGFVADSRIRKDDSHFDAMHGGYRGYDGKCLPKDIKTLVWQAKQHGVDVRFLEQVIKINNRLRGTKA